MINTEEIFKEIDMLSYQIEFITQEKQNLSLLLKEIDSLSDIKNTEVILPISNGIYIKVDINKINDFLVNVGANVVVKKDKDELKELLTTNITDISRNLSFLNQRLEELNLLLKQDE